MTLANIYVIQDFGYRMSNNVLTIRCCIDHGIHAQYYYSHIDGNHAGVKSPLQSELFDLYSFFSFYLIYWSWKFIFLVLGSILIKLRFKCNRYAIANSYLFFSINHFMLHAKQNITSINLRCQISHISSQLLSQITLHSTC